MNILFFFPTSECKVVIKMFNNYIDLSLPKMSELPLETIMNRHFEDEENRERFYGEYEENKERFFREEEYNPSEDTLSINSKNNDDLNDLFLIINLPVCKHHVCVECFVNLLNTFSDSVNIHVTSTHNNFNY